MQKFEKAWTFQSARKTKKILLLLLLLKNEVGFAYTEEKRFLQHDAGLAKVYLNHARIAYQEGLYHRTRQLLAQAEEFCTQDPQFYLFSALLADQEGDYKKEIIYLLKADNLVQKEEKEEKKFIEKQLFQVYFATYRYDDLNKLYEQKKGIPALCAEKDLYYLLTLERQKRFDELSTHWEQLFPSQPSDVRFYIPILSFSNFTKDYLSHFRQLARWAAEIEAPVLSSVERALFVAALRRVPDADLQKELVDLSFAWLKKDINFHNLARYLHVTLPEVEMEAGFDSLYIEKTFLTEDELTKFAVLKSKKIGVDTDGDGFPEQYGYFDGKDGFWIYDFNQDGFPEYRIEIRQAHIASITEWRGSKKLVWATEHYPYVQSVDVMDYTEKSDAPVRRLHYQIEQFNLCLNLPEVALFPHGVSIPNFTPKSCMPSLYEVLQCSTHIDEYKSDDYLFRKIIVKHGEICRIWEDSENRGFFDRMLEIQDGKVVYGQRKLNKEQGFEVYEYYDDGVCQGLVYFPQDVEFPVYYESWNNPVRIKLWLFDESQYVGAYSIEDEVQGGKQVVPVTRRVITPEELLHWKEHFSSRVKIR